MKTFSNETSQAAIDFADWICKQGYKSDGAGSTRWTRMINTFSNDAPSVNLRREEIMTTEELFELYLKVT